MANTTNSYCGSVTSDGKITSNGNFISHNQINTGQYYIDYNGAAYNPITVISLTGLNPGMSYVLNVFSAGFRLYVYDMNGVPIDSSFNFIVASLIVPME